MALSQWDMKYLSPEQQAEVLNYKNQWASDPTQRDSLHTVVEQIRASAGYSGGIDGSQYIPIDNFNAPKPPAAQTFNSPYTEELRGILEDIRNQKPYESPYEDLINQQLSAIMNRPKFDYNADEDPAYQAFLQRATRAGDKAYADNLGGLSAMTGGRPNSWAGTVASQARNQYVLQAQEAVIQFEDRAYSRYKDEGQEMYNLLNVLNSQDSIAYGRYRDGVQDKYQFADMVLKLEDREFEQFKFNVDQNWKIFDTEYQAYKDALSFKKDKINEAIDRSNMLGFVNNQDSITLGVPAGTLSQAARERAEKMEDYIRQQEIDIETYKKQKQIDYEFDVKLLNTREAIGSRSGGGGGLPLTDKNQPYQPTKDDMKEVNAEYNSFVKFVESEDFKKQTEGAKYSKLLAYEDMVIRNAASGMYGDNSEQVGELILQKIESHPTISKLLNDYVKAYERVQAGQKKKELPTIPGGRYSE